MTTARSGKEAPAASDAQVGSKHKTEGGSSPDAKKAKTSDQKEQQLTLEESFPNGSDEPETKPTEQDDQSQGEQKSGDMEMKDGDHAGGGESAVEPGAREDVVPSNILEKGIIYFFFRGRVGIYEPEQVDDIARSYLLLRPMATDAKLGEGPIGDAGNTRLCALPKKVLPLSGKDRFMVFVEKSGASFQELKDEFLSSSDYATKTAGTRHTPAATPIGEGVYAITSTGRESHLAYMLTLPDKLGEVQKDVGLREKGSFIISTKNPDYPGPANARLPQGPEYPKKIKDEFRSLRWMPTQPHHLDYANTQFLLIGESSGLEKAVKPDAKDQKAGDKEEPLEEMEKLEEEDTQRMQDLSGDDSTAIFTDLGVHAKDYPKLQTTF